MENFTKLQLLVKTSFGQVNPVTDDSLKIIFDNLPETTGQEAGTKLMISLCYNGLEHEETQRLAKLSNKFLEEKPALFI